MTGLGDRQYSACCRPMSRLVPSPIAMRSSSRASEPKTVDLAPIFFRDQKQGNLSPSLVAKGRLREESNLGCSSYIRVSRMISVSSSFTDLNLVNQRREAVFWILLFMRLNVGFKTSSQSTFVGKTVCMLALPHMHVRILRSTRIRSPGTSQE